MKMPGTQQETCRFKTQTYQQTTMTHTIGLHSVQSQGPVSFHHRNVFHALMHDTVSSPTFFFLLFDGVFNLLSRSIPGGSDTAKTSQ